MTLEKLDNLVKTKLFFMYGFEENQRANISKNEKEALQKAAKVYFGLNGKKLTEEIRAGRLVEIKRKTK